MQQPRMGGIARLHIGERRVGRYTPDMLARVRFVLVEPAGPANLGAVCRAMANFGLADLVLVSPRCAPTDPAAIDFAMHGRAVLDGARVVTSIPEALAGCVATFAATSKDGLYQRQAGVTAHVAAELAARAVTDGPVAFAFGREDRGLLTQDLLHFDRVVSIPASAAYPVLNLASAATVIAYEVYQAALATGTGTPQPAFERGPLAIDERKHAMYRLLFDALERIGFFRFQQYPDHLRHALRTLFGRAEMSANEVDILIGMARQIGWYANQHPLPERRPDAAPSSPDAPP